MISFAQIHTSESDQMHRSTITHRAILWLLGPAVLVGLAAGCGPTTPEVDVAALGISVTEDLDYVPSAAFEDGKDLLDLYTPRRDGFPTIVFVHGGGLTDGSKGPYGRLGGYLAREGFGAAIVNYRLTPEVAHPAHTEDLAASIAWVHENISSYGGDPERIYLLGHSAGAYLIALVALDPRYLAKHDLTPKVIAGVVPISGFFHVDRLAPERDLRIWGEDPAAWLPASPSQYASKDAPPMLLLYADGDDDARRKESLDLKSLLAGAGAQATERMIEDRNHISIIRSFGSPDDATAALALDFFRELERSRG